MIRHTQGGILLAGGGTAGHVNPLLAVADELRARHPECRLRVLGTKEGLEADLVPRRGYELSFVPRVPLPRRPSAAWFSLPGRLRAAVAAAGAAMDEIDARVVVGFGGYVSTPAYLAARRRRIPVVVHEQNVRPGLANRLGARRAAAVAVTFPGTPLRAAVTTGLPLRAEIVAVALAQADERERLELRRVARTGLGLDPDGPLLLVTGGSLGAQRINEAMAGVASELLRTAQVLHLTGRGKAAPINEALDTLAPELRSRYQVREYLDGMGQAYAAADVVLCRAGAGTVCELAAVGLPAIYVPLAIGNGEQARNARGIIAARGGILVPDGELDAKRLLSSLGPLLSDPTQCREMADAAAGVGVVDGAQRVADLVDAVGGLRREADPADESTQ